MRVDRVGIIARREYLAQLRTKGFWIATIALPLFVVVMGIVPALLTVRSGGGLHLVVVDRGAGLGAELARRLTATGSPGTDRWVVDVEPPAAEVEVQRAALDARVRAAEIDAWVWIDDRGLENNRIEYHAESVSNFLVLERLERALSEVVRTHRLLEAGFDPQEIERLTLTVDLSTVRVTEEGSREEGAAPGIVVTWILFFLLYMVLILYGQQVMTAVLEEKSSRIVEVLVATTRPFELMMGKLAGICLTALTQLAIWMATLVVVTLPGVATALTSLPPELEIPAVPATLLVHFVLLFVLGFFLYSTLYAAIGAAFNNVAEAQQFAGVALIFLIAPVLFFWTVLNEPDSALATIASLIPPFTPLLMMLRIAVKTPPAWQVALGYALTALFTWLMVWMAARVYRVGILMYGKKPTVQELWRWIRYAD